MFPLATLYRLKLPTKPSLTSSVLNSVYKKEQIFLKVTKSDCVHLLCCFQKCFVRGETKKAIFTLHFQKNFTIFFSHSVAVGWYGKIFLMESLICIKLYGILQKNFPSLWNAHSPSHTFLHANFGMHTFASLYKEKKFDPLLFHSVDFPGSIFLNQHSLLLYRDPSIKFKPSDESLHPESLVIINLKRFPLTIMLPASHIAKAREIDQEGKRQVSETGMKVTGRLQTRKYFCESKSCRILVLEIGGGVMLCGCHETLQDNIWHEKETSFFANRIPRWDTQDLS